MRRLALVAILALAACSTEDKDTPEVAARKDDCRKLIRHMFEISPETRGRNPDELMKGVSIEDIEQCAAIKDRSVIACLHGTADVAAVKACIPAKKD